jgi:hypothetical protein
MSKVQFGDLATWLAAAGTVAAFFLAFGQLEAERKSRRNERIEEQAQKISAWVAKEGPNPVKGQPPIAWIAVLNNSSEPIYEVIVTVVRFQHIPKFLSFVPPGKYYTKGSGDLGVCTSSQRPRWHLKTITEFHGSEVVMEDY